jgi:two-component system nitrogen regulation sensor histidine kinase GlnL
VLLPMFNPTKNFDQSNRDDVSGTPSPASQDAR